jgi:hypothetical protein
LLSAVPLANNAETGSPVNLDSNSVQKEEATGFRSPSLPYSPVLSAGSTAKSWMPLPMEPGLMVCDSDALQSRGALGGAVAPGTFDFSSIARRISSLHDPPDWTSNGVHVSHHPQMPDNAYTSAHQSLSSIKRDFKVGPAIGESEPSARRAIVRSVWASSLQDDSAQATRTPR